ncbi:MULTISPECIES: hypothetical protein [Streptomyces]|uniref:hypothetical protein n=1 Tax=Streptomyces TaxID=1883 RepID=UPI00287F414F|nr:hypothetical protein [Streptomyces sp. CGMCC 4.1456]WNF63074.1 hypothetical protein RJD14_10950 [Streptomyces sp. CGMCC 4.1456]
MAEKYPLVEQREYGRPDRRGGIWRKRVSRGDDELPRVAAHHVRVFRVGEEYVEDHGQLRADDPVVTGASSVTVVDRRIEVPVVVETRIPSAEAGDFTVRACFYCTVTDPSAVVRDGVTDVEALLLAHLREVPGLTEDGSDLPVVDTAAVRARIDARLTAYHEMRPSLVSGIRARHGSIEVLTPEEMSAHVEEMERARLDRTRRRHQEEMEQQAALDRALREAELELKHEEIRNLQALRKERNRQEEETLRTGYERDAGAEQQDYELTIERRRNRFTRAEIEDDIKLIGSDPVAADYLAWRNGDISADELSKRLHAAEERWDSRKDDRLRLDRDYEMTRRGLDREDLRWQVEREDRRHELTRNEEREETAAQRHEASRRWDLEHEDRLRQRHEKREDTKEIQRDQHELAKQQLTVRATLGKQAIDRGLFDSTMYDAGAFINSVGDVPPARTAPQGELKGGVKGELRRAPGRTAEAAPAPADGDDADDFDPANQEGSLGN